MRTQQHFTQIIKPHHGKLVIEIPGTNEEVTYQVIIDVTPQQSPFPTEEQEELIDRLFGSIPDLPEVETNLTEYPLEQRDW